MKINLSSLLLVCCVFKVLGVLLYLRGFLAVRKSVEGYATFDDQPREPAANAHRTDSDRKDGAVFGRLVIIMIDALRADFVLPVESSLPRMKFFENLINQKETISFKAKANPPTVTMPRIKALTSGTIPTFVDIVLNVDSKSLQDDNIVTQLHRHGKKIVFYGDDTWMKLFPEHFVRSDGTTSFFVPDYTEVDLNVTRHLDRELSSTDWDVMILHYLGLDHIGHLAGPRSPLVPDKLDEMDNIVKRIFEATVEQDSSRELPTLLVLCGDHGMSEQGSHGGSTPSEVTTPVVLLSSAFSNRRGMNFKPDMEVQQIDLTPTLSTLLGVPIPQNNLGVVIPEVLQLLPMSAQLGALHANIQQLSAVFETNVPNYEKDELYSGAFTRAVKMHENWLKYFNNKSMNVKLDDLGQKVKDQYIKVMVAMRDRIATSLTNYDLHSMGLAIALLWMVLLTLIYGYKKRHQGYVDISLGIHGSFVFLVIMGLLSSAHFIECTEAEKRASYALCSDDHLTSAVMLVVLFGSSLFCTVTFIKASRFTTGLRAPNPRTAVSAFLALGTVVHTFSLLSSSFVEEEHQTWYFFTLTALLLMFVHCLHKYDQQCKLANQRHMENMHFSLYQHLNAPNKNHNCTKGSGKSQGMDNIMDPSLESKNDNSSDKVQFVVPSLKPISLVLSALILCRMCRIWNQTGDKWSHLPDLGDWLVLPENKAVLSAVTAAALVITVISRSKDNPKSTNLLLLFGCACVYCFRTANGALNLPFVYNSAELNTGTIEARMVYAVMGILLVDTFVKCRKKMLTKHIKTEAASALEAALQGVQNTWILFTLLCVRPHNISLVTLVFLQEMCLRNLMKKMYSSFSPASMTLLYLFMGQTAFYYQGNSNSFTTIDVSVGFIGLEQSQIALGSLLVLLSTYSGPIFWTISLIRIIVQCAQDTVSEGEEENGSRLSTKTGNHDRRKKLGCAILEACFVLVLTRALPLAVYMIMVTAQRYHLFVWTVFSPKLLYEGLHTAVVTVEVLILLGIKLFI